MTDYAWPTDLVPYEVDFYLQSHSGGSESPFSRQTKTYGLSAPRWLCTMRFKTPWDAESDQQEHAIQEWQARLAAFIDKLQGRTHRVLLWDFRREQLGSTLANEAISPGDTLITVTGGIPKVGDYVGGDGRPHRILEVSAGVSAYHCTVTPPYRDYVEAGEADFERVPGRFMLTSDDAGSAVTIVGQPGIVELQFVEDLDYFDPASLFAGTAGFWYDFSNPTHLYRTVGFSAPVTAVGQTVGYVRDLSGNDTHCGQATIAERPTFGLSEDGVHGIEFDGVDDFLDVLSGVYTAAGATTIVAAVKFMPLRTTSDLAQVIYCEKGSSTGALYYMSTATLRSAAEDDDANAKLRFGFKTNSANVVLLDSDEAVADDQIRIASLREDSAHVMELWIDNRKEASTGSRTGTLTLDQTGIGAIPGASPAGFFKGWMYGILGIQKALTDSELLKFQEWMAARYYSTRRAADGTITLPVLPKEAYFHGNRLAGSVTTTNGVRVTDFEWDGKFRGRAYSPFSMGAADGDAHSAPAMLALSDGRLLMGWTGHNANAFVRVTTGSSIAPGAWETTRSIRTELGMNAAVGKYTYFSAAEMATGTFLFIRGRTDAETDDELGYWYAKAADPADTFATAIKFVAGDRPYIMWAKRDPWRVDFQFSTGHPNDESDNSIWACYMEIDPADGTEAFYKLDGTPLTLPMDPEDMTLIHDGTTDRAWIGSVSHGADGHPRHSYDVYNDLVDDHTYWHARWTGSTVVANAIVQDNGLIIPGVFYATGNATLDPEDPNIAYVGRLVAPETVIQIWRYTSDDDGVTWTGEQLTDEEEQCFAASIIEGAPEPRLVFTVGPFDDEGGIYVGDTRRKLVNSVTGEDE